jgi:uncharacterized membrane protein YGL010W
MKPMELIAVCQMFLVPVSILFGALALAAGPSLKTLISLLGLITSGVWFYRLWFWPGIAIIDRNTVLALAGVFAVAWLMVFAGHAVALARRRPGPPR